jgi:Flp pilus assembly protein TadD
LLFILITSTIIFSQISAFKFRATPQIPQKLFSPSNSKSENNGFIPASDFIKAARCAECHQETHEEWSESLHRNSGREPFYKASVNILEKKRGTEFAQHCESCHSPTSLFSGAMITGSKESREMDDEGITCSVCHSITDASPLGTSSYTIRKPYLLLDKNGIGKGAEANNQEVLDNIEDHKRAVMNPTLRKPEFCGACHKSNAPPELNNYKFIRGYSTYDEWQQSAASKETVQPFYSREKRMDCNSCHMPKTEAEKDLARKDGLITSHRWLGANTAVPMFYGQKKQVELTEKFLKNNVLSLDIFALKKVKTNELIAPLNQINKKSSNLKGEEVVAEVVIFNRGAAHSFPPELRDLYEPWVEFEAIDKKTNKTIFHSGFLNQDGTVDEKAHVYKSILLDELGKPFTKHQVWLGTAKAYDAFIPAGRADLVRYRFKIPNFTEKILLRAKVNYRRFIKDYADFVEDKLEIKMPNPTVEMVKTEILLGEKSNQENASNARRWNDYGIGLLGQAQYGEASNAFRKAAEIEPNNPDFCVNAAIAEMQTERFGPEMEQIAKATQLLQKAIKLEPNKPRTNYYWAINRRSLGLLNDAESILQKLSKDFPTDREVQRQLGQIQYRLGKFDLARKAFSTVNIIDPTDADSFRFLSILYKQNGLIFESNEAQKNYLLWRDDPNADIIANKFYNAHPEWADVRTAGKIYSENSPKRPTITGENAAAER